MVRSNYQLAKRIAEESKVDPEKLTVKIRAGIPLNPRERAVVRKYWEETMEKGK